MTTSTQTPTDAQTRTGSPALLRASAVVFAAAYAVAMFVPTLPEGAYSDARVLALLDDGGDRTRIVLGGYALALAGCAFLVFVAGLRSRLGLPSGSVWGSTMQGAAAGYAAVLTCAAAMFSSIPLGIVLGELEAGSDTALYRAMSNTGFHLMLVGGLLLAALVVVSASAALRQRQDVPRWLPVVGFVIAPLLLLGFAWVPQFLVPVWVIAVAAALGRD